MKKSQLLGALCITAFLQDLFEARGAIMALRNLKNTYYNVE